MLLGWLKRTAPRSLYARATLILLLPVVTVQIVVSVVFIQRHFEDVTDQMTETTSLGLRHVLEVRRADPAQAAILGDALGIGIDARGPVLSDARDLWDLSGRVVIATLRDEVDGIEGVDLVRDDDAVIMTVREAGEPVTLDFSRDQVSASNPHQLPVLMVFTAALMTIVAYLFLKNQIRPIRHLAEAAEAFGKGRSVPYRPAGASEVRSAGAAFLAMRHRIERQIEQRTLMLSGVSHDLRTPLTRLKLSLSLLDDPDAADMRRDVDDMQHMLDSFLDFAREGVLDDPVEADPAELLRGVVERARRGGQDIRIASIEGRGVAPLRPMAVIRALENLVGNAARHARRTEATLQVGGRAVVFTVEDDGPGIPEAEREAATRPFFRLERARGQNRGGSVGLGLAIAIDIARQHGGTLRLGVSRRLGGLRVDLVLAR